MQDTVRHRYSRDSSVYSCLYQVSGNTRVYSCKHVGVPVACTTGQTVKLQGPLACSARCRRSPQRAAAPLGLSLSVECGLCRVLCFHKNGKV